MAEFSQDWVTHKTQQWQECLGHLVGKPKVRALEIGSFEGRSASWFLDRILTGDHATIDCVDCWQNDRGIEERFDHNTARFGNRVRKHKTPSLPWLVRQNVQSRPLYDLIYVDGDHEAAAVMQDLTLAWPLLRPGGTMICDDYRLQDESLEIFPRVAIDGFFACRKDWELVHQAYQFVVRKRTVLKHAVEVAAEPIEAVVVCSGFADYLSETLPLLVRHVDKVVVVTSPDDEETMLVTQAVAGAELLVTDRLFAGGATFNKGAAINEGLKRLTRQGWVLQLDADIAVTKPIVAPSDRNAIWGAQRRRVIGREQWDRVRGGSDEMLEPIDVVRLRDGLCPSGYFQLWHWRTHPRPYPTNFLDASRSDIEFARQWPPNGRRFLAKYSVCHLETSDNERGVNWRGRRTRRFDAVGAAPAVNPPQPRVVPKADKESGPHELQSGIDDLRKDAHDRPSRGVLTAANSKYWPVLRVNVLACLEAGVEIAVVDHGFTDSQRQWLAEQGAAVVQDRNARREVAAKGVRQNVEPPSAPEAWLKPSLCRQSPFDRTLWIDADAVPLRGWDVMFRELEKGPWLTLETWAPELRSRQMYLSTVKALVGRIPANYRQAARINSGVFGFRRGDRWVDDWARTCTRILSDPRILAACRLRDQAALVALLCSQDQAVRAGLPRILEDRTLNWPANGCQTRERKNRKRYRWEADDCLDTLRNDHPDISVVHWMGSPKPWAMGH